MFKKVISVVLAVVLALSMTAIAVSAANVDNSSAGADTSSSATGASGNVVYFDASGWTAYSTISCHIWENGGESFFGWLSGKEKCTKVQGTVWSYDLDTLKESTEFSGGLQSGKQYCIVFYANTGVQTYDTTFGTACKGDTAYLTGKTVENPVDSSKKADECTWENNSGSYGPHLAITSIGNIVGDHLCQGENGLQAIGDWLPRYYLSPNVDSVAALAKAFPKFGVDSLDDIETIYAYILSKDTGEDELEMQLQLQNALYKAYPSLKGKTIDTKKAEKEAKDGDVLKKSNDPTGRPDSPVDGQETVIFFVLAIVMVGAAGVMFMSRKKRED